LFFLLYIIFVSILNIVLSYKLLDAVNQTLVIVAIFKNYTFVFAEANCCVAILLEQSVVGDLVET